MTFVLGGGRIRISSCDTNMSSEHLANRKDSDACNCHDVSVCPPCVHPHPEKTKWPGDALRHLKLTGLVDFESKCLCDLCEHATQCTTEDTDPVTCHSFIKYDSHCTMKRMVSVSKLCPRSPEGMPCKHYGTDSLENDRKHHSDSLVKVLEEPTINSGHGSHILGGMQIVHCDSPALEDVQQTEAASVCDHNKGSSAPYNSIPHLSNILHGCLGSMCKTAVSHSTVDGMCPMDKVGREMTEPWDERQNCDLCSVQLTCMLGHMCTNLIKAEALSSLIRTMGHQFTKPAVFVDPGLDGHNSLHIDSLTTCMVETHSNHVEVKVESGMSMQDDTDSMTKKSCD